MHLTTKGKKRSNSDIFHCFSQKESENQFAKKKSDQSKKIEVLNRSEQNEHDGDQRKSRARDPYVPARSKIEMIYIFIFFLIKGKKKCHYSPGIHEGEKTGGGGEGNN